MFDPSTLIRLRDNSLKPISELIPNKDEFYDSKGQVRPVLEVIHSDGPIPRYELETTDYRKVIVDKDQTWLTTSAMPQYAEDGNGNLKPRIYSTLDIPVKPRDDKRPNLMRFLEPLSNAYYDSSITERAIPELRAILEVMGEPLFLDVDPDKTFKQKISKLVPVRRAKEIYWHTFDYDCDYTPFRIHPEVFNASPEYKVRYLASVFYLCGDYKPRALAYLAHPNPDFIKDVRSLVWSLGGITPNPYQPLKLLVQKSINRIGTDYHYTRIHCREVNLFVPGNYFTPGAKYSLAIAKREELEPGPMCSLVSDENCYFLNDKYLPLYLPEW